MMMMAQRKIQPPSWLLLPLRCAASMLIVATACQGLVCPSCISFTSSSSCSISNALLLPVGQHHATRIMPASRRDPNGMLRSAAYGRIVGSTSSLLVSQAQEDEQDEQFNNSNDSGQSSNDRRRIRTPAVDENSNNNNSNNGGITTGDPPTMETTKTTNAAMSSSSDDNDNDDSVFRYHHLRNVERILCLSDLHTDHPQNYEWVETNAVTQLRHNDVVIVAGDIAHQLSIVRSTLRRLTECGCHVLFVPGNHEAWLEPPALSAPPPPTMQDEDKQQMSSFAKLESVYALCREEGVLVDPVYIDNDGGATPVWILPLESWYDGTLSFDETLSAGFERWPWVDFDRCRWPGFCPAPHHSPNARIPQGLVEHFLARNQKHVLDPWRHHIAAAAGRSAAAAAAALSPQEEEQKTNSSSSSPSSSSTMVITVSHFAPNQQCLPDWKDLSATTFQTDRWLDHGAGTMSAKFAKVAGTALLDEQIRRNIITSTSSLSSSSSSQPRFRHIHVFGHSHRPKDFEYESIRYVHNPLGKPRERDLHLIAPNVTFQRLWERKHNDADVNDKRGGGGGEVLGATVLRYWEQFGGGTDMLQQRWDRVRPSSSSGRYNQR
jgi:predicted phosphodiesterase